MLYFFISSLLFILAGICNAAMDVVSHHYDDTIFSKSKSLWFGKDSWKLKYKNGDKEQGERFLGSTTIFCFVTDFWHFAQFMWANFIIAGGLIYKSGFFVDSPLDYLIMFVYVRIIYLLTFNMFYEKLFIKSKI